MKSVTSVGLVVAVLSLSVAPVGAAVPHGFWIQPDETGAAHVALRAALTSSPWDAPAAAVPRLAAVATANPDTAAAGLARLAAGLLLLDAERPSEALPYLRHPDVARTALGDYALFAIARSLEAGDGDPIDAYRSLPGTYPDSPLVCPALLRGADAALKAAKPDHAVGALEEALTRCPGQESGVLARLGRAHEARGDRKAAAAAYDRIDHEYPTSAESDEAARRLKLLGPLVAPGPAPTRRERERKKALALFDAGRHRAAAPLLRTLLAAPPAEEDADLLRVRLGRSLAATGRWREAQVELAKIPQTSPWRPEAAYALARIAAQRYQSASLYEVVANTFPQTPWAEEALMALCNHYQKDAQHAAALPYYRRLLEEYPGGTYAERATQRVGLGAIAARRYDEAARVFEQGARRFSASPYTAGFLYWAGRSRVSLGEVDRGRGLLEEVVRRYKHAYHGVRAREALARLPKAATPSVPVPVLASQAPTPEGDVAPARLDRVRQLLLIERLDDALEELKLDRVTAATRATTAWIQSRRGRLRPAIIEMKRAYPEYLGENADRLPKEVLQIIYPLQYREIVEAKARAEGLDPALVSALICQESTFDAGAVSPVGARGLMQIMPGTGRTLARNLGVRYNARGLYDPQTSLTFGTRYLRQMLDRFGGRVERALAAYNAGPHRVDAWTATQPDVAAEDFVENIPFTETRWYVMIILANVERYRTLYSLGDGRPAPAGGA